MSEPNPADVEYLARHLARLGGMTYAAALSDGAPALEPYRTQARASLGAAFDLGYVKVPKDHYAVHASTIATARLACEKVGYDSTAAHLYRLTHPEKGPAT